MSAAPRRNSILRSVLLGVGGVVLGVAIAFGTIQAVGLLYQGPGSILATLGLIAVLTLGAAMGVWLRLPRLRTIAVGLVLGVFTYTTALAVFVVIIVRGLSEF